VNSTVRNKDKLVCLLLDFTVRVKNKLYVFQNKIATKSKQNSNKIKTKQQQNQNKNAFVLRTA